MSGFGFPRGRPPKKSPSNKNVLGSVPVPQMAFADAPAFWNTESCAHWTVVCFGNTADWVLPNDPPMSPEQEDWFKTEKLESWSVFNNPNENCTMMDVEFLPSHPRNRYGVMRLFSIPIGYPACIMPYNIGFLTKNDSRDGM
jgi:hypothetical protein